MNKAFVLVMSSALLASVSISQCGTEKRAQDGDLVSVAKRAKIKEAQAEEATQGLKQLIKDSETGVFSLGDIALVDDYLSKGGSPSVSETVSCGVASEGRRKIRRDNVSILKATLRGWYNGLCEDSQGLIAFEDTAKHLVDRGASLEEFTCGGQDTESIGLCLDHPVLVGKFLRKHRMRQIYELPSSVPSAFSRKLLLTQDANLLSIFVKHLEAPEVKAAFSEIDEKSQTVMDNLLQRKLEKRTVPSQDIRAEWPVSSLTEYLKIAYPYVDLSRKYTAFNRGSAWSFSKKQSDVVAEVLDRPFDEIEAECKAAAAEIEGEEGS